MRGKGFKKQSHFYKN